MEKMSKKEGKNKNIISAEALREFSEIRRIFNKAVEKAVKENRKAGITDEEVYNVYGKKK